MHLSEENGPIWKPLEQWVAGKPGLRTSVPRAFSSLSSLASIRTVRQDAGSDFKTLYASTWCYSHHLDGYQFPNLAAVFRANKVVEPQSWYGHAPVYPPFTPCPPRPPHSNANGAGNLSLDYRERSVDGVRDSGPGAFRGSRLRRSHLLSAAHRHSHRLLTSCESWA